MGRAGTGVLVAASLAAMAGCSSGAALSAVVTERPDYSCEDITVPAHTLTDGRRASELSAAGRRTVLATEGVTRANLNTWRIVEDSTARVTIIRPLDAPEKVGDRVIASHQYVDRTPNRKAELARSRWTSVIPLTCTLRELVVTPENERPAAGPAAQEPGAKLPGTQKAGTQKAGTQKAGTQGPATQKAGTQKPAAGKPGARKPAAKVPAVRKAPRTAGDVPMPVPVPMPKPVAPEA